MIPVTRLGLARKRRTIVELEAQSRAVGERVRIAREHGDLRENAEYQYGREEYARIQMQLAKLHSDLVDVCILLPSEVPTDYVGIGSTVMFDQLGESFEELTILSGVEVQTSDLEAGIVSKDSPIGQVLMGRRVGEAVTLNGRRKVLVSIKNGFDGILLERNREEEPANSVESKEDPYGFGSLVK